MSRDIEAQQQFEDDSFDDDELVVINDELTNGNVSSGNSASNSSKIPDVIVKFINLWHKAFLTNNSYLLYGCYSNNLNKVFDKFYKNTSYPSPIEIAPIVNNDQIFIILYSECYYRHIYAKLSPSLEVRTSSFNNYCNLFNLILNNPSGPVSFELPNKWLWDIVDEFIYQFNQFQVYKSKLLNKSNHSQDEILELEYLQDNQEVWSTYSVLNALYSLVGRSNMVDQLKLMRLGKNISKEISGEYGSLPLYKNLGYFSIIGLLRIHTILGDYTLALKTIEHIELNKKAFFTKIPGCHFTTYYYVGFCFMMMNRYQDAIKSFQHILLYISRTKNLYNKMGNSYDIITKKSEQMFALLTICISLCPTRLDDILHQQLKEKFGDQLQKITRPENKDLILDTFEELFKFGAPRFIDSNISLTNKFDHSISNNANFDPLLKHWKIFKLSILKNLNTPNLKFYLNLYSSLELTKLLKLMDLRSEQELNELLLSFKLNNRQLKLQSAQNYEQKSQQADQQQAQDSSSSNLSHEDEYTASLLNGTFKTIYDIDIKVDGDHVNVLNFKSSRKYGDWFIRNAYKNYGVIDYINNLDSTKTEK
ncbi:hypothetical protein PACTADRAFT_50945 [Pachysolen tannophilus NRRL Y-2460]|uniref:Eukaryotic translation initiation factor 3 subunit L n=1 Tax=Pachysolen tannophilus NRRL Y-2460 TaxID=669874 RepID=A0A1E4TQQ7_PACTA|nr:hypothetical protein PACTADRAFT_50945 [Pachysolen tannophilus NRRL Y-2460]